MLDFDLAKIYGCSNGPTELNYIVRKNIRLFSKSDYFLLTNYEYKNIIIRNKELEEKYDKDKFTLPYAFSEYSVYLLSSIIKTPNAADIQRDLIINFIKIKSLYRNINLLDKSNVLAEEKKIYINSLFLKFNKEAIHDKYVFYEGSIYKYQVFMDMIICKAKKYIVIIDNHADINVIKQINKNNIKILLITNNNTCNSDIKNIVVRKNIFFKDVFIFVDGDTLYHANEYENNNYISINIIKDKELIASFRRKLFFKL